MTMISGNRNLITIRKAILYITLVVVGTIILFPIFWMASTSFKTLEQITKLPAIWFPIPPQWNNYPAALTFRPFGSFAINTLVIAFFYILGNLLSSTLVGYGFARFRFPGKKYIFYLMLSTMMMPEIVTIIPMFVIYKQLGWINTILPLIVPSFFGQAFFIFIMRQNFLSIPKDISDAAKIDGASEFRIWWNIMLPLAKPAIAAIVIFSFQRTWNDYLSPLIYLTDPNNFTLSVGLISFTAGTSETVQFWNYLMAVSVTMVIPMVVLFMFAQKQFIQGTMASGLKG